MKSEIQNPFDPSQRITMDTHLHHINNLTRGIPMRRAISTALHGDTTHAVTVRDALSIDPDRLSSFRDVGEKTVDALDRLQRAFQEDTASLEQKDTSAHVCGTCPAYEHANSKRGDGFCHYWKPRAYDKTPGSDIQPIAEWLRVLPEDWCMKHPKLAHLMEPTK